MSARIEESTEEADEKSSYYLGRISSVAMIAAMMTQRTRRAPFLGPLGALGILCWFLFLPAASAATPSLTLRYTHFVFTVAPATHPEWQATEEVFRFNGRPVAGLSPWRAEGDSALSLPPGVTREERTTWNREAIAATLEKDIAPKLARKPSDVTIRRNATGTIVFDGVGMTGRSLELLETADLVIAALENGASDVILSVREIQPKVTVEDPALQKLGIREIVTVGESNFAGSPIPRRHNIVVGLGKFNGHLIPQGEVFSFNDVLGRVDASTGYWKELVIMGEYTLPEYGGGLCQVSTTAYRGVWEYGFPIVDRKNHSFAVSYYAPEGTDATIYPPNIDMKFENNGPSALLIQTYQERDLAYFIYYGTRDTRSSMMLGPYLWDFREPPPDREEGTTEIPPGTQRKASDRHGGMKAVWSRVLHPGSAEEKTETVYSSYEARGFITQIGVAKEGTEVPGWIGPAAGPTVNN